MVADSYADIAAESSGIIPKFFALMDITRRKKYPGSRIMYIL
jgi:hypothetical protein